MNIIFILIPLGLLLLLFAVAAFFWAVRAGQFDDLESPAWRIVLDDDRAPPGDPADNPAAGPATDQRPPA
ncbi:MAG: cbb3-type cytochrome oxidase assembly protein CcoS [Gammaproteobacteria bacterium]|nr:cbb3-type cytochrome oxidase assembly protein CcoS [Gammaproteobacteria bacterium]NND54212.1 cbb3-type cytochrome oxidase assembly protein CcoS [Gammaproteobacteria bacterium]